MRHAERRLILLMVGMLFLTACGDQVRPPKAEEGVLTYAALNPITEEFGLYIDDFNKSHSDVKIEIRDYSDENGVEQLLTELALGWVPDIMEMYRTGGGDVSFDFYFSRFLLYKF